MAYGFKWFSGLDSGLRAVFAGWVTFLEVRVSGLYGKLHGMRVIEMVEDAGDSWKVGCEGLGTSFLAPPNSAHMPNRIELKTPCRSERKPLSKEGPWPVRARVFVPCRSDLIFGHGLQSIIAAVCPVLPFPLKCDGFYAPILFSIGLRPRRAGI